MNRQYIVVRVVITTDVTILLFDMRFALLHQGSSTYNFTRVLSASMHRCKAVVDVRNNNRVEQRYKTSQNITDKYEKSEIVPNVCISLCG